MKMKKWIAALAALGVAVGLTACGGKDSNPTETEKKEAEQEIRYALTSECHYIDGELIPEYEYTYDSKGQLTRITIDGEVKEVWDEEKQVYYYVNYVDGDVNFMRSFEYDQGGMVSRFDNKQFLEDRTLESTRELEYTYDSKGMVISCVMRDSSGEKSGNCVDFSWLNGNLIKESFYEELSGELDVETYSYEYLDNGMLHKIMVDGVSVELIYDANDKISAHHLKSMETGVEIKIPVTYDQDGNMLPRSDSNYKLYFDEHGNLSRVEENGHTIVVYTYQPFVHDSEVLLDGYDIAQIRQREYLNGFVPGLTYAHYVYGIETEYTYIDYIYDIG